MLPELGRIGPITIRTYTLLLDIAILIGLGMLAWTGRREENRPAAWVDAGLGAVVVGILAGRIGHILVHYSYFASHPDEILRVWHGGLSWHAAVIGGLIGLAVVGKWRKVPFRRSADTLALVVPLGVLLVYTGCLADSCGHGREVESLAGYPPLIAAEMRDLFGVIAPRLNSQLFGVITSLIIFTLGVTLIRKIERPGARLWPVLALISLAAFGIGFTRGDSVPMVGKLRLDQVLDLGILFITLVGMAVTLRPPRQIYQLTPAGFVRRQESP